MKGHQPLIDLRRHGYKPAAVFVFDGDIARPNEWNSTRYTRTGPLFAEVRIDASDTPEVLDLRWAIGLHIHLSAWRSLERGRRLHEAFIAQKASLIATDVTLGNPYRPSVSELWIFNAKTQKRTGQCPVN